jgi:hypothetical protein
MRPPQCGSCARCPMFRYAPSRPEEVGQWHLPRRKDFDLKAWQQRVRTRPHEYACIGCDVKVSEHEVVVEDKVQRQQAGLPVGRAFMPLAESGQLQESVFGQTHAERISRGGGQLLPAALPAAQLLSPTGGRLQQQKAVPRYQGIAGSTTRKSEGNMGSSEERGEERGRGVEEGVGGGSSGGGGDRGRAMPRGLGLEEQVERGMITAAEYHKLVRQQQTLDDDNSNCGSGKSGSQEAAAVVAAAADPRPDGVQRFKRLSDSPIRSRLPLSSFASGGDGDLAAPPGHHASFGAGATAERGTSSLTLIPVRSHRDGRPGVVVTNLGRPMPQPGKNWERARHP